MKRLLIALAVGLLGCGGGKEEAKCPTKKTAPAKARKSHKKQAKEEQPDQRAAKPEKAARDKKKRIQQLFSKGKLARDKAQALEHFKEAAELGHVLSLYHIGNLYKFGGKGVQKDAAEAAAWYRKGAEKGNSFCQSSLAWMYFTGDGVEKSREEAIRWMNTAAAQESASAKDALEVMKGPQWRVFRLDGKQEELPAPPDTNEGIWKVEKTWKFYDKSVTWITSHRGTYNPVRGAKETWFWSGEAWAPEKEIKGDPARYQKCLEAATPEHLAVKKVLNRMDVLKMIERHKKATTKLKADLAGGQLNERDRKRAENKLKDSEKWLPKYQVYLEEGKDSFGRPNKPPRSLYRALKICGEIGKLELALNGKYGLLSKIEQEKQRIEKLSADPRQAPYVAKARERLEGLESERDRTREALAALKKLIK